MGVQPVQRFARAGGQPLGEQLGVRPGTDRHRDVDAPAAQVPVLLQRLAQEDVLPAAEQQHRHVHAIQRRAEPQPLPELMVCLGAFQPRLEPRCSGAEHPSGRRTQGRLGDRACDPARCLQLADSGLDAPGVLLTGNQIAPAQEVVGRKRAGAPHRRREIVRARGDDGRCQLRRGILQYRPLGESQVRQADGGESAGEPGLLHAATRRCRRRRWLR